MSMQVKPLRVLSTRDVSTLRLQLVAAEYVKRMGRRIATARADRKWTQAQLARKVEELRREREPHAASIESATISRWETGKVEPNPPMKEYLASALEVPVSYFMMDEPDKSKTPDLSLTEVRTEFRGDVDGVQEQLAQIQADLRDARTERHDLVAMLEQRIEQLEAAVEHQNANLQRQTDLLERIEKRERRIFKVLEDAEVIERVATDEEREPPDVHRPEPAAPLPQESERDTGTTGRVGRQARGRRSKSA